MGNINKLLEYPTGIRGSPNLKVRSTTGTLL